MRAGFLVATILLSGCSPRQSITPTEIELSAMRSQIARLEREVTALRLGASAQRVEPAAPSSGVDLIVSWPDKGGNDYRRTYRTAEACEAARQVVLDDNERRRAAAQAAVGSGQSGARIVAVGAVPAAVPICLPG